MRNMWVWTVAIVIVIAAALFALLREAPAPANPFGQLSLGGDPVKIRPLNAPVVTGFLGDLLVRGNKQEDGTLEPFVCGESLKLECEAHNAVEYRWAVNGTVLKEKDQEWTSQAERFYEVWKPGKYNFTVEVRGADKSVSLPKSTDLDILPLKIMTFEKNILHPDDERFLTGSDIVLEVSMAQSMGAGPDFYEYRYFVNDELIKNPENDPDEVATEWTNSSSLIYTFPAPGSYTFKVEARRTGETAPEDRQELSETIICGDAVLLSFDSVPDNEKGAVLGSQVWLSSFPISREGKSECRFGVKKINVADYTWLPEETGTIWGDSGRTWVPIEAGTYLIRCEVRELGKQTADDFREMYFTIVDGNF